MSVNTTTCFCAADESDFNNPEIFIEGSAVTSGWRLMPAEHHLGEDSCLKSFQREIK